MKGKLQTVSSLLLLLAVHAQAEGATPAKKAGVAPAGPAPTVHDAMLQTLVPTSNTIWALAGSLYDSQGNIDPKQLTSEQWTQMKDAATTMGEMAKTLAAARQIKAAAAGAKLQDEDAPGAFKAADVQAALDADPKAFNTNAAKLAALADELVVAARAHDGKRADAASAQMADVCGACHAKFWYPNQQQ